MLCKLHESSTGITQTVWALSHRCPSIRRQRRLSSQLLVLALGLPWQSPRQHGRPSSELLSNTTTAKAKQKHKWARQWIHMVTIRIGDDAATNCVCSFSLGFYKTANNFCHHLKQNIMINNWTPGNNERKGEEGLGDRRYKEKKLATYTPGLHSRTYELLTSAHSNGPNK
uniref:Uncharacterized protein n=1 Tax=Caenorhabditis japonica TaxID=281687 RepID=A0A8R1EJR9_CAEJA